jgi:hypothetical protein
LKDLCTQTNDLIVGPTLNGTGRWKTAVILWLLKLIVSNARIIFGTVFIRIKNTLPKDFMEELAISSYRLSGTNLDEKLGFNGKN